MVYLHHFYCGVCVLLRLFNENSLQPKIQLLTASYNCICRPMLSYSFLKFLCYVLLSTVHTRGLEPSLQTFSKLLQFYLFFNLLIGFLIRLYVDYFYNLLCFMQIQVSF